MRKYRPALVLTALVLALVLPVSSMAYQKGTLYSGVRSEDVRRMQEALIQLGYLGGVPDGVFGTHTELAVKKFQKENSLKADGVAGAKTLALIYQKAGVTSPAAASAASVPAASPAPAASSAPEGGMVVTSSYISEAEAARAASSAPASAGSAAVSSAAASGSFGGNYATLKLGDSGARVKTLQKLLISLGYLKGSADGKFGKLTQQAVISFQSASRLAADGKAGRKTLSALEKETAAAAASSAAASSAAASSSADQSVSADAGKASASSSAGSDPSSSAVASGPSGGQVKLLHWFSDVKPTLKSGQTLYIYEPSSGQGWNLRIYSCGRHCDAEPASAEDTASMLKAFGGANTWSQKAVYVRLPNGSWTVGSTHDMPHMSGAVKDNNFNGHLCVHFLRTMSEAKKYDPSYGVANQNTIRAFWKSLTGEEIAD